MGIWSTNRRLQRCFFSDCLHDQLIFNFSIYLVGGIPTPLKNDGVKVSWDDDIPNIWKVIVHSCSKPPTISGNPQKRNNCGPMGRQISICRAIFLQSYPPRSWKIPRVGAERTISLCQWIRENLQETMVFSMKFPICQSISYGQSHHPLSRRLMVGLRTTSVLHDPALRKHLARGLIGAIDGVDTWFEDTILIIWFLWHAAYIVFSLFNSVCFFKWQSSRNHHYISWFDFQETSGFLMVVRRCCTVAQQAMAQQSCLQFCGV